MSVFQSKIVLNHTDPNTYRWPNLDYQYSKWGNILQSAIYNKICNKRLSIKSYKQLAMQRCKVQVQKLKVLLCILFQSPGFANSNRR